MLRPLALVLALGLVSAPAWAENRMVQSPLMMRRAGPSCQPGNLGGEPGAGYSTWRLGPCAGVDQDDIGAVPERRRLPRRTRRY